MGKVITLEELLGVRERARSLDKTVVFTNGCFDIIHRGHVYYLERAKALGDLLVVGLNSDDSVRGLKGGCRPVVPQEDRAEVLAGLASVDFVCIFDEPTPYEMVSRLSPDVLVKGAGYSRDTMVGADLVEEGGGKVVAVDPLPGRSTRSIIKRILKLGDRCLA